MSTTGSGARTTAGTGTGGVSGHDEMDARWVDARPFRAHLRHLMSAGSLDVAEVAVVLGLPTRTVRNLLEGRAGRVPRRISPPTARRLLLVRPDDVQGLRWRLAPADEPRAALGRLRASGWSVDEVASAVGFGLEELAALDRHTHGNRLLAVRLVGLARGLPAALHDEDRDDEDLHVEDLHDESRDDVASAA
ncbi:hypothetical protein [Microlunatus antarcticus]|uniref:Uncharacterized protein n=1 Tax=Microlunatus antarcticus TaxID=53388 RepID=A0A7W5JXV4_9ACTN|nr:hypothetical protein [Microlunatus antarcticus]MBB3328344.1 hypothetical protein [Microlunatus antarcticus]